MGTRCITTIRSTWDGKDTQCHATIYRHWDGYPHGQGKTLFEFLDGLVLVNGIGGDMPKRFANGPGRLAAQLVIFMQQHGHNPDLMPTDVGACGQEYHYDVFCDCRDNSIKVTVYSGPMTAFGMGGEDCDKQVFSGTVAEYGEWLAVETAKE